MNTKLDSTSFSIGRNPVPISYVTGILLVLTLMAAPCRAHDNTDASRPKLLMIEFHGLTPYDSGLYKAIRAQLSAVPITLERVGLAQDGDLTAAPLENASALANEHRAAMVFWIEDKEICRMFFYLPGPDGGHINSRALNLDNDSEASRFEVIAIAVASMVEGLLVTHHLKPVPSPEKEKAAPPPPGPDTPPEPRKWIEIFADYAGSLFAKDSFTHGARMGLGLLPIDRLVLAASYTQNLPLKLENDEYRLAIISRIVGVSVAGRLSMNPVDFRLGVSWSIDLRSYSTISLSDTIDALPDGFKGVNSLTAFMSAAWVFGERIGIFVRTGANLALNETNYKVDRDGRTTEALKPFFVKLTYHVGLRLKI